jgi:hypothetical protein
MNAFCSSFKQFSFFHLTSLQSLPARSKLTFDLPSHLSQAKTDSLSLSQYSQVKTNFLHSNYTSQAKTAVLYSRPF